MINLVARIRDEFSFFKGNYLILIATWLIMDITNEIPTSFFELYVLELGGTVVIIGLINFCLKIAFAAVSFPGGHIADKFGRKGILIFSTLAMGFNFLIFAFAPDWRFILLAMVTGNLLRISNPALQAITADSLPPKKRGLGYSIQQITIDLTSTPAPLLASLLFEYFGFVSGMRVAYIFVSASYFIAGIIRYRLTETLDGAERIKLGELLLAFPRSYVESFKMLFTIPESLRYLIVTNNLFSFAGSFFGSYIIVYATTDLGLSKYEWSLVLTAQAILTTLLIIPIGKAIDVFGAKKMMIIFYILIMVTIVLTISANFLVLFIVMPLMGIAYSASGAGFQKLTADLTQRNLRGKMVGLFRFFSLIVGAVGSLLGGYIYENTAHVNVFIVGFFTLLIGTVLFAYLVKEPKIEEI
ncbi:MAG: MFS transporter [Candidatus Bathyarchaeota archaeon]|nr:MFS transporter [Candidatus Bathyarchaeota archaeon]